MNTPPSDTIPVEEHTQPSVTDPPPYERPKTSAELANEASYAFAGSKVPIAEMRCPICSHPAALHEAMQGPCHHGEGTRSRCECASFGGGEWKPAEHGVAGDLPGRPMSKLTPLQPGTPPPTGPTKHTLAVEAEGEARLAMRAAAEEREREAERQIAEDSARKEARQAIEAARGLGDDRRSAIERALRAYVKASHPTIALDCGARASGMHCCLDPEHANFKTLVDYLDQQLAPVVLRTYDKAIEERAALPEVSVVRALDGAYREERMAPEFEPGDVVALKSTLNDGYEMTVNGVIDGKVDVRFFDDMGYQRDLIAAGALRRVPSKSPKNGRR